MWGRRINMKRFSNENCVIMVCMKTLKKNTNAKTRKKRKLENHASSNVGSECLLQFQ
jgi:hypothetical protein